MSETVRRRVHERRPELISDALQSYLIDSHGSGSSARPADPSGYSPAEHAAFYDPVRAALGLDRVTILGH